MNVITMITVFFCLSQTRKNVDLHIMKYEVCGEQYLCFTGYYICGFDYRIVPNKRYMFIYTQIEKISGNFTNYTFIIRSYALDIIYNSYIFNFGLKFLFNVIKYQYSVSKNILVFNRKKDEEVFTIDIFSNKHDRLLEGMTWKINKDLNVIELLCVVKEEFKFSVNYICYLKTNFIADDDQLIKFWINNIKKNIKLYRENSICCESKELFGYIFEFNFTVDHLKNNKYEVNKLFLEFQGYLILQDISLPKTFLETTRGMDSDDNSKTLIHHKISNIVHNEHKISFLVKFKRWREVSLISERIQSWKIKKIDQVHTQVILRIDHLFYSREKLNALFFTTNNYIESYVIYFYGQERDSEYELKYFVGDILLMPSNILRRENNEYMELIQHKNGYKAFISLLVFGTHVQCSFFMFDKIIKSEKILFGFAKKISFHHFYELIITKASHDYEIIKSVCINLRFQSEIILYFRAIFDDGTGKSKLENIVDQVKAEENYNDRVESHLNEIKQVVLIINSIEACGVQYVCIKGTFESQLQYRIEENNEIMVIYTSQSENMKSYTRFIMRVLFGTIVQNSYEISFTLVNESTRKMFILNVLEINPKMPLEEVDFNSDFRLIGGTKRENSFLLGTYEFSKYLFREIICLIENDTDHYLFYICYLKTRKMAKSLNKLISLRIHGIDGTNLNPTIQPHCCDHSEYKVDAVKFQVAKRDLLKSSGLQIGFLEIVCNDGEFSTDLSVPSEYLMDPLRRLGRERSKNFISSPYMVISERHDDDSFDIYVEKKHGYMIEVSTSCKEMISVHPYENYTLRVRIKSNAHLCQDTNAIFVMNGTYIYGDVTYFQVVINREKSTSLILKNERVLIQTSTLFRNKYPTEFYLLKLDEVEYQAKLSLIFVELYISCDFRKYNTGIFQYKVDRKFLKNFDIHYHFTVYIKREYRVNSEIIQMVCINQNNMNRETYYLNVIFEDEHGNPQLKMSRWNDEWVEQFRHLQRWYMMISKDTMDVRIIKGIKELISTLNQEKENRESDESKYKLITEIEKRIEKIEINTTFENVQHYRFAKTSKSFSFVFRSPYLPKSLYSGRTEGETKTGESPLSAQDMFKPKFEIVSLGGKGFSELENLTISLIKLSNPHNLSLASGLVIVNADTSNVTDPEFIFNFTINTSYMNDSLWCVWMKGNMTKPSSDGCDTKIFLNNEFIRVMCICNHLTSFSVMFGKSNIPVSSSEETLTKISAIIPISISMFFLLFQIISLIFMKKQTQKDKEILLLSTCLLFVYIMYVISAFVHIKNPKIRLIIKLMNGYSVVVLYLTLALIGYRVYRSLVVIEIVKHWACKDNALFLPPIMSTLWLIPTYLAFRDSDIESLFIEKKYYIFMILPLFCIILATNLFIFIKVKMNIKKNQVDQRISDAEKMKSLIMYLYISLGLTWILQFFTEFHMAIDVLFNIINGSQGIILFFLKHREILKSLFKSKTTSSEFQSCAFALNTSLVSRKLTQSTCSTE